MITRKGFGWLPITDKAKEVFSSGTMEIYTLHSDDTESLCETMYDIDYALQNGLDLAIEIGYVKHLNSSNHYLGLSGVTSHPSVETYKYNQLLEQIGDEDMLIQFERFVDTQELRDLITQVEDNLLENNIKPSTH